MTHYYLNYCVSYVKIIFNAHAGHSNWNNILNVTSIIPKVFMNLRE